MSYSKKTLSLLTIGLITLIMLFSVNCKEEIKSENAAEKSEEINIKEDAKEAAAPVKKKKIKKAVGEVEAGS